MTTSTRSPNIFLFADPRAGERHGYFDGWAGFHFHYAGKGRRGDQRLRDINLALSRHREAGLSVRLFRGARGRIRYLGEFALDREQPMYRMDAPQEGATELREVIVFKLVPVGQVLRESIDDRRLPPGLSGAELDAVVEGGPPVVDVIPVEQQHTTRAFSNPPSEPIEVVRKEQMLVLQYTSFLEERGSAVSRLQVVPSGEANAIRNDVFDTTRGNLIEAKGTANRGAVRTALGQLLDYSRFAPDAKKAVLLPSRPRRDLEKLLFLHDVGAIWPESEGFADNSDGAFT
jgi:hypothetical protein